MVLLCFVVEKQVFFVVSCECCCFYLEVLLIKFGVFAIYCLAYVSFCNNSLLLVLIFSI